jgi:hypothetical protein
MHGHAGNTAAGSAWEDAAGVLEAFERREKEEKASENERNEKNERTD